MFLINNYIIYGASGICQVKEIGNIRMEGADSMKLYYTLIPLHSKGSTIYTPVDNHKVYMRNILSKEEAIKLIRDIPNIETIRLPDDKKCEQIYKESLKKHECGEWIKIIKFLYLKKYEKVAVSRQLSSTDKKYLNLIETNLFDELALSLELSKEEIQELIIAKIHC